VLLRKTYLVFFLGWTLVLSRARAECPLRQWDWNRVSDFSLTPDFSYGQKPAGLGAWDPYRNNDVFLIFNTQWRGSHEEFSFEARPEIRAVASDTALTGWARAAVQAPPRPLNLQWNLGSDPRNEAVLSFERLVFNYQSPSTEISIGRKPVGLGVLSVFPVWNKFSRPMITAFGPLTVYGQDRALARYQSGAWAMQAMAIEGNDPEATARFAEGTYYGENLEAHVLAGSVFDHGAAGFAVTGDVAGMSWRLEEISFSGRGVQAGLGAERAFNAQWSGLVEFLYLEEGASDKNVYLALPEAKNIRPLNARGYGFARVEYKPWDLWVFQLGYLANFVDSSGLVNGKVVYSLSNESELSLEARHPLGGEGAELSTKTLPGQVLANLHWVF